MSSLLTCIKRSDGDDSRTSSVYSSPSICREETIQASPSKDRDSLSELRSRKSSHLLDHTNDLRGSGSRDGGPGGKRSSARSNLSGHGGSFPDMSHAQQENFPPTD